MAINQKKKRPKRAPASASETARFHELRALVLPTWPAEYADQIKEARPYLPFNAICNAGSGRTPNLPVLVEMIAVVLPDFLVPAHLLPTECEMEIARAAYRPTTRTAL
jgi:hypothetical protein